MVRTYLSWAHRAALTGAGVAFLYFAATLVLPLSTMGDPVFDTAMLRARWFEGRGILPLHLLALAVMAIRLATGPARGWAALALVSGTAALAVISVELDLVTRHGDLVEPRSLAEFRLTTGRWATFLLSGLSLWALWRGRHD